MPNGNELIPSPAGNLGGVQKQLMSLFEGIETTYNKLKETGQSQAAFALREAASRYARSGAALGVNAFSRARALEDLKSQIVTAARDAGAKAEAQKLSSQLSTLNQIGATQAQAFNQAMQSAQFEAGQKSELWRQQFSETQLAQEAALTREGLATQRGLQTQRLGAAESQFARNLAQRQQEATFAQERELATAGAGAAGTSLRSRFANRAAAAPAPGFMEERPAAGSTGSAVQRFTRQQGRPPTGIEFSALGQGVSAEFAGRFHFRDPRTGVRSVARTRAPLRTVGGRPVRGGRVQTFGSRI
jgi:hypothetical protein